MSVTNARFPVNNGEMWYLEVNRAKVVDRQHRRQEFDAVRARGGSITSCDDSIPDYHFEYREAKRTGNNTIVARPAVLYIKDVPVMWLPFIFSDTRSGTAQRHSRAAVRRRRHRAQQPDLPPQRRQRRLLLGAQRLHGRRHLARLAKLCRRADTAIRAGFATTPTGTTSGSIAFSAGASA